MVDYTGTAHATHALVHCAYPTFMPQPSVLRTLIILISFGFTLMAFRFFDRFCSRTRAPSTSRTPRSSDHRPPIYTDPPETLPQHVRDAFNARRYYSRPPDCHVLAIIDFRDLAELDYIAEAQSQNFDLLEENNFDCMGYIETASLFTWSRHFNFNDATRSLVGNLCD